MRTLLILFIFALSTAFAQEQLPFQGKLVYHIQIMDTSLRRMIPDKEMVIYTNDTLLRIENSTDQLGNQVLIKHMVLNKSYLLLETPINNYAIQTDHSTQKVDSFPYQFKKKWGKRKIAGLKANRLMVTHSAFEEPMEFLYFKKTSNKYLNAFTNFPGLLAQYYVVTVDGIFVYTLTSMETMKPEHDLFGIPSDFKKVTFDQFMDEIMNFNPDEPESEHPHE
jgi:hypothetical protein